ncbi:MAG: S8 family serine peptidase [Verrucomicrobiae bacterium]|nr:S8 family serine peptidase [Verrucomicrobiae bacterium]
MSDRFSDSAWPSPDQALAALREGSGEGIRIAVIDSGVDFSHPALATAHRGDDIAVSTDGIRLIIKENSGEDVFGHGTAVAGTIHHVAPHAEIGSFRALDGDNRSRSFIIAECARQAIQRGYHIINCSFGCRGLARHVMEYKDWTDAAYVAGIHVVAAGSNLSDTIREWPAHFPSVIGVGMADCGENELRCRPDRLVCFAAKGERVRVPWLDGGWRVETGSSFAAPRVTGFLARLLSQYPSLRPDLAKALLRAVAARSGEVV